MKNETAKELKNYLKPTDTIGIIIKTTSQSGMSRRMRVITKNFTDISHLVADLLDLSINDTGILVSGCGMDMTFWLAQAISDNLWGKSKLYRGNGGSCINWQSL